MSYPASMMIRARVHREAGWPLDRICDLIEQEMGRRPSRNTVLVWTSEEQHRKQRQHALRMSRRRAASGGKAGGALGAAHHSPEFRMARASALRNAGLDPRAVALVMAFDYGEPAPATVADAPPSMSRQAALERAAELSRKGWSWTAIAQAMTEYHGQVPRTGEAWRTAAGSAGLEVARRPMTEARAKHLERLHAQQRPSASPSSISTQEPTPHAA